ncbi:major pollen allergen Ole e 1 [Neltuma alba]|uniref:major pollen allergen Ole e 1-like n=1 Tax=Neltuma alba TaxID=207710 RepID=UPI0010A5501B|nr:major pollen allergen Ole e 1-like [Prosopis alba]XP_028785386.1 major pollen allergen Ole e 1-like [Prosopis alba]
MNPMILFLLISLFTQFSQVEPARPQPKLPGKLAHPNPEITVMGFVYCDICSNNSFSRHSYFLPGAEVRIDCVFKALSAKTEEQISVSVNRTTNKYGMYKLEIPSVDGVRCAEDSELVSSCQANLIGSSTSACNVPGHRTTSDEIAIKVRRANLCIYSLNALNFRPTKRDITLCGN